MLLLMEDMTLHTFYNNIPIDQKELCKGTTSFTLAYSGLDQMATREFGNNHFYFPLPIPGGNALYYYDSNVPGTGVIRTADYDLDGWVDIAVQYKYNDTNTPHVGFLQNVPCSDDLKRNMTQNNPNLNTGNCRYFTFMNDNVNTVTSPAGNPPVLSVSFFDYAELG